MSCLFELDRAHPVAHVIGVLSLVCVIGMALSSLRFRDIALGNAGVLLTGIGLALFRESVDSTGT